MIRLKKVTKSYGSGEGATHVLKEVDLEIKKGEFVAIMGPSGSGKSTLLNILGALDVPSDGDYFFAETNVRTLSKDQLALFRRYILGFVFQGFNLLKKTSALENVEMPLIYLGLGAKVRRARAMEALTSVGLEERMHYDPGQLSGGQQQRVAIARALSHRPSVLLADEPTGNLDESTADTVIELLETLIRGSGSTMIMATHSTTLAATCDRTFELHNGKLVAS